MKLLTILMMMALVTALAVPLYAADTAVDSPQSLYLKAGKEERAGSAAKAREIYESIIDRFPESEFAVKANDRLLALPTTGQKAVDAPTGGFEKLFSPSPAAPLPADPQLRRGVEAARAKARAEVVRREEYERLKRADDARDGSKLIKANRSAKEAEWRQKADSKVVEEFGMSLDELAAKLAVICKEAGVKGECSEEKLLRLAPAAKAE